ncbi:hypothetical protein B0H11DRAFT_1990036, partial [Mycena galericulata]
AGARAGVAATAEGIHRTWTREREWEWERRRKWPPQQQQQQQQKPVSYSGSGSGSGSGASSAGSGSATSHRNQQNQKPASTGARMENVVPAAVAAGLSSASKRPSTPSVGGFHFPPGMPVGGLVFIFFLILALFPSSFLPSTSPLPIPIPSIHPKL